MSHAYVGERLLITIVSATRCSVILALRVPSMESSPCFKEWPHNHRIFPLWFTRYLWSSLCRTKWYRMHVPLISFMKNHYCIKSRFYEALSIHFYSECIVATFACYGRLLSFMFHFRHLSSLCSFAFADLVLTRIVGWHSLSSHEFSL